MKSWKSERYELKIGSVSLENPFILAPMAGVTDPPMRRLCRQMGASLTYTEMVSAKGIYYDDRKTKQLLFMYPDEAPTAIQIFGHEPDILAYAANALESCENAILDLNCGCPAPKIVKNNDGSALLNDPKLIESLVRSMVMNTSKPVTVKIRIGYHDGERQGLEAAIAAESGGASAVAVHGRTRDQYYSGKSDWSEIARIKYALKIPVIGNGDVTDSESASKMMEETNCDAVMIGRAALGNPWIFKKLIDHDDITPKSDERKTILLQQFEALRNLKGDFTAVREMRKIAGWYVRGMRGGADLRRRINTIVEVEELERALAAFEFTFPHDRV